MQNIFNRKATKPVIIAGPCMAESIELLHSVVKPLRELAQELNFDLIFKASFDKANRTSIDSYRGPGPEKACSWFRELKSEYQDLKVLTDVHETSQITQVSEVVDVLQIPAFLCRQTDLVVEAVRSGRAVNVKKGQFLAPENCQHILSKIRQAADQAKINPDFALTERGVTFGYGNLVVDMRSLKIMSDFNSPVIFDITHSLQLPAAGGTSGEVSGGLRNFAPTLARAATASGYLDGYFLEVHREPNSAKSDAATQLSVSQAQALLRQIVPLWYHVKEASLIDSQFT